MPVPWTIQLLSNFHVKLSITQNNGHHSWLICRVSVLLHWTGPILKHYSTDIWVLRKSFTFLQPSTELDSNFEKYRFVFNSQMLFDKHNPWASIFSLQMEEIDYSEGLLGCELYTLHFSSSISGHVWDPFSTAFPLLVYDNTRGVKVLHACVYTHTHTEAFLFPFPHSEMQMFFILFLDQVYVLSFNWWPLFRLSTSIYRCAQMKSCVTNTCQQYKYTKYKHIFDHK